MPLFQYQALDNKGHKQQGNIEAQNEKEAKEKLRDRHLMVTHISDKSRASSKQALKGDHLVAFTMQLAQLVNAGVPLYESLVAIEEQYQKEPFHPVILSLCEQVKGGVALSTAMKSYPDSFNKLYAAMVAAGEVAGALGMVLERLSLLIDKQLKLKKDIMTAMIYPGVLACFSLIVIVVLLGFVVPSIEGIFAGRKLNHFTEAVLFVSRFFRNYWWMMFLVTFSGIAALIWKLRTPDGKLMMERMMLKIPLIRRLVIEAAIARFSRTMATLQQGGLPMIESLRMSTEVLRNAVMEEEMKVVELRIIEGSSLSAQLSRSRYIPQMVSRMVAIGEDSGNSVVMFQKIADMYENSLEKSLTRITALVQPMILIIMGGIIGLVMLAILLPLTDLSSFSI